MAVCRDSVWIGSGQDRMWLPHWNGSAVMSWVAVAVVRVRVSWWHGCCWHADTNSVCVGGALRASLPCAVAREPCSQSVLAAVCVLAAGAAWHMQQQQQPGWLPAVAAASWHLVRFHGQMDKVYGTGHSRFDPWWNHTNNGNSELERSDE
jgi:hypothetical protein